MRRDALRGHGLGGLRGVILRQGHGLHFGGPGRRTLFSIQLNAQTSVHAIDTLVQGYQATEWKRQ